MLTLSMDTVLPQREQIREEKSSGEDSPYASIYTPSDNDFVVTDNENSLSSSDSTKNFQSIDSATIPQVNNLSR